jgi:hypothetical protein
VEKADAIFHLVQLSPGFQLLRGEKIFASVMAKLFLLVFLKVSPGKFPLKYKKQPL